MIESDSSTYAYLLADTETREAALIDPVLEKREDYKTLLRELDLTLLFALDTHTHADHVTALGHLRDELGCRALVGQQSKASCATGRFHHHDTLSVGAYAVTALYTPGHTDDSYSFHILDGDNGYVFTGDTLLIRGSGRTDFQNGDALQQYHSLHHVLLSLPPATVVYPGHDYKGWTQSTIAEEASHNPRLQLHGAETYATFMAKLNLPNPKLMDIAVPLNQACGKE
ncbi:MAG: sulfur dioxygenase [Lentisphaeria bacterium]